jgi:hypothetical protein
VVSFLKTHNKGTVLRCRRCRSEAVRCCPR